MIYTKNQGKVYAKADERNGVKILCHGDKAYSEAIDEYFELLLSGEYDLRTALRKVKEIYGELDFNVLATVDSETEIVALYHGSGFLIEECSNGGAYATEICSDAERNRMMAYSGFSSREYPAEHYKNIGFATEAIKSAYRKQGLYPDLINAIVEHDEKQINDVVMANLDSFEDGITIII